MKKKQLIIIIALICVAATAVVLILVRSNKGEELIPSELEISDVSIDKSKHPSNATSL